jgi:peroxiredoxin
MNIKIPVIAAIIISTLSVSSCRGSVSKVAMPILAKDTTTHTMLHLDANSVYLDTAGNKIDAKHFMESMKTGKYTFVPDIKDGKAISVKLKLAEKTVSVSSMAPEFSGTDLNGHAIDLKALRGKTVVLNFWFTSCAPCLQEMPQLNGLVDKYKNDHSVEFLAVTYNPTEQVKSFLTRKDFKFNILAGRADIIKKFGINSYPTSMIIDKTGNIAFLLATYDGTNVAQLDGVIGALKSMK